MKNKRNTTANYFRNVFVSNLQFQHQIILIINNVCMDVSKTDDSGDFVMKCQTSLFLFYSSMLRGFQNDSCPESATSGFKAIRLK